MVKREKYMKMIRGVPSAMNPCMRFSVGFRMHLLFIRRRILTSRGNGCLKPRKSILWQTWESAMG